VERDALDAEPPSLDDVRGVLPAPGFNTGEVSDLTTVPISPEAVD
jgi:hypothetical protein